MSIHPRWIILAILFIYNCGMFWYATKDMIGYQRFCVFWLMHAVVFAVAGTLGYMGYLLFGIN